MGMTGPAHHALHPQPEGKYVHVSAWTGVASVRIKNENVATTRTSTNNIFFEIFFIRTS
jgi:hypothetical protein